MSERTGNHLPVRLTRRGRIVATSVGAAAVFGLGCVTGSMIERGNDPKPADCAATMERGEDFWTLGEAIGERIRRFYAERAK